MKLSRVSWPWTTFWFLVALAAMQFAPYGDDRLSATTLIEPAWDAPATRALAKQACFDCHSNVTNYPAYARIAPVAWVVARDISDGRAVLNFSEWQRPRRDGHGVAEEVLDGDMPPLAYWLVHAHARLSDADRRRLARGLAKTLEDEPGPN